MDKRHSETIIGYSGFILFDGCYEYCEDACYLAHSVDSVNQFMINCGFSKSDFRIDEISIGKLLDDYGYSSGEYAMEEVAFEKFKLVADDQKIDYQYEDFYMNPDVKIVRLLKAFK